MSAKIHGFAITVTLFFGAFCPAQDRQCRSTMLVTVLDEKTNQPIDGLATSDFAVKATGHQLQVRSVTAAPKERRIVVVLDRSGTMTIPNDVPHAPSYDPNLTVDAVLREVLSAVPEGATVALLAFSGSYSKPTEFMKSALALQRVPEMLQWEPAGKGQKRGTPLWDNIDSALQMLNPYRIGDLVIVVSDGGENDSKLHASKIQSKLIEAGVPLFATLLLSPVRTAIERFGSDTVIEMAAMTGGMVTTARPAGFQNAQLYSFTFQQKYLSSALPVRPSDLLMQLAHQYQLDLEAPIGNSSAKWQLEVRPPQPWQKLRLSYPHYLGRCEPGN